MAGEKEAEGERFGLARSNPIYPSSFTLHTFQARSESCVDVVNQFENGILTWQG